MNIFKSVLAIVVGYVAMVAGAWVGQEAVFPGTEYGAPAHELLTVGILTAVLAGTGGAVTAFLAPSRPYLHLLPMAALISFETIMLYANGRVAGPLWFELLAGASLIAGTIVGAWLVVKTKHRAWPSAMKV